MEKENIFFWTVESSMGNGKMEKELNGLNK